MVARLGRNRLQTEVKVPITVFVWDPAVDMYGHASMHIQDGPYISWWPGEQTVGKKGSKGGAMLGSYAFVNSMRGDKSSEGRPPTWASAPITCLDEEAIKTWWSKFSGCPPDKLKGEFQTSATYNVLTTSCSGVVFRALVAGGLRKHGLASAIAANLGGVVSPEDVKDVASALSGEMGFWDTARFMAIDAVVPGDARDIVKYGFR